MASSVVSFTSITKAVFLALVAGIIFSSIVKTSQIWSARERNEDYSNFLCATSKIKVQIGSYREASEDIRTFFKKFDLQHSSHSIKIGATVFHPLGRLSKNFKKYQCYVEGRPDIDFKIAFQLPVFFDLFFYKLTILGISASFFLVLFLSLLFAKYQNIVSSTILWNLRRELDLIENVGKEVKVTGSMWKMLSRIIDFEKIKLDVKALKTTIEEQRAQLTKAQVKEALLDKEISQNREFSAKVEMFIHDIKSPIGLIGVLRDSAQSQNQKSYLNKAKSRLDSLLTSLTNVRSHYNLKDQETIGVVTVKNVLKDILTEKRALNPEVILNLKFPLEPQSSNEEIQVNPDDLGRHFSNLIDNSIEASAQAIDIEGEVTSSSLILRFCDNGIGISPESVDRVFEKGFSLGKSSGSGLGLFSLQTYISKVGGSVSLTSELGKGTIVDIALSLLRT